MLTWKAVPLKACLPHPVGMLFEDTFVFKCGCLKEEKNWRRAGSKLKGCVCVSEGWSKKCPLNQGSSFGLNSVYISHTVVEAKHISVPSLFTSSVLPEVVIPLDTISVSIEREHILWSRVCITYLTSFTVSCWFSVKRLSKNSFCICQQSLNFFLSGWDSQRS